MSNSSGENPGTPRPPWQRRPLALGIVGSLLLFVAQPPLGWSLAAWIAPLPWLYLATQGSPTGRRWWLALWFAGFVYWVLAVNWIRLAHPATFLGLLALSAYFGAYLPLFVSLVRTGVLRWRLPAWIVAPVVWVAIEWLQANLFSGFLMAALGHTQVDSTRLVQIADLGGAYMVSALVMLVAACLFDAVRNLYGKSPARAAACVAIGMAALLSSGWYGGHRLQQLSVDSDVPEQRLALIQGNERAVWTSDPGRDRRVMEKYFALSLEARQQANSSQTRIDLMVWPEGAFRTPLYTYDPAAETPTVKENYEVGIGDLVSLTTMLEAPLLVGLDRVHFADLESPGSILNAAAAVDRQGKLVGTYDKTHLVMFGEYVPGGNLWPGIYQYFPIGGLTPGKSPAAFDIGGVRYMPTICYETVMPHVVRKQVAELAAADQRPDVLVNMTNDSWFYDSSELAMHLTCTRLRAIECRTPVVVAANGGMSANIDRCGHVLDVGQAMTDEVLLVAVTPGGDSSIYLQFGDTFAIGCLLGTVVLAASPFVLRNPAV